MPHSFPARPVLSGLALAASAAFAALAHAQPAPHAGHPTAAANAGTACEASIEGRPGKRFSTQEIRVSRRCETFTVHLVHTGRKPWQEAGHNWVLARSADIDTVIADGQRAGPERAWVPRGDARIIAATQMLSGGEHASVSFPVSRLRADERYTYYCSFPTHAEPMRGQLVLVD
ncbi:azurin [Paracidovorax oryzae]|uniref:azurin n=1 Tax=Paracidovorax oryzae TaxID=862720 RepID=UPI00047C2412|nr:azurin [Paracidovorax oryzae]